MSLYDEVEAYIIKFWEDEKKVMFKSLKRTFKTQGVKQTDEQIHHNINIRIDPKIDNMLKNLRKIVE